MSDPIGSCLQHVFQEKLGDSVLLGTGEMAFVVEMLEQCIVCPETRSLDPDKLLA